MMEHSADYSETSNNTPQKIQDETSYQLDAPPPYAYVSQRPAVGTQSQSPLNQSAQQPRPGVMMIQHPQVISQQPQAVRNYNTSQIEAGTAYGAAFMITVCTAAFLCLCSLFCSLPAMYFALKGSTAGTQGNSKLAKTYTKLSCGCSIAAVITAILAPILLILLATLAIVPLTQSRPAFCFTCRSSFEIYRDMQYDTYDLDYDVYDYTTNGY